VACQLAFGSRPPPHYTRLYLLSRLDAAPSAFPPVAEVRKGVGADMVFTQQLTGLIGGWRTFTRKRGQALSPGRDAFA
jgi:hypothetical protein